MNERSLKPVIETLEKLFIKFNERFYNNELQKPIIAVNPDTTRGAYGWCTGWKIWSEHGQDINISKMDHVSGNSAKDGGFYEINICAEYLSRSFSEVAGTLLHEMVHLYNLQIGISDTSRSGKYHNKKFKKVAEQHGLIVKQNNTYGWSITQLNDDAINFINDLGSSQFQLYRLKPPKSKPHSSTRKYVCPTCRCIVRATKDVYIICGVCGADFRRED